MDIAFILISLVKIVGLTFGLILLMVAYTVYAERRFSAILQDRVGPNRVGIPLTLFGFKKDLPFAGLLQPIADGIKFLLKEDFTPAHVNKSFYWLAPCLTMVPALITVAVIPFSSDFSLFGEQISGAIADVNVGPLIVFAIASLSVYGITLAGWASNSKYSFIGGVRSCAQMISYEISLGLSLVPVLLYFGDLNLGNIVQQQAENGWLLLPYAIGKDFSLMNWILLIPMVIAFFVFTISIFAETNRMPFDLPECETELVGGYHTEYSSMKFALFFLGEYAAMIIGSALIVTLFLGGWSLPLGLSNSEFITDLPSWITAVIHLKVFLIKVVAFILFFIWVRWSIPRFRYDQLMNLGWIVFFELALINVFLAAIIIAWNDIGPKIGSIALIGLAAFSVLMVAVAKLAAFREKNNFA